jgi:hypothetical protein
MQKGGYMRCLRGFCFFGVLLVINACGSSENPSEAGTLIGKKDQIDIQLIDIPKLITNPSDPTKAIINVAFEGQGCSPKMNDEGLEHSGCIQNLICVPDPLDLGSGTCRLACGKGESCPKGRSCQKLFTDDFLEYGDFCMPTQHGRDDVCSAFESDNACGSGMTCMAGSFAKNKKKGTAVFTSLECRVTCDPDAPNASATCPQKPEAEICIPASYTADKKRGLCVVPVPLAKASDVRKSGRYVGPTCNERDDHQFCDRRSFERGPNKASPECSFAEDGSPGLCLAVCGQQEIDLDGNGKIEGDEKGFTLQCPVGYECSKRLPRAIGMVKLKHMAGKSGKIRICNMARCKRGMPCPRQCGRKDKSECLPKSPAKYSPEGYCGVVMGHCEAAGQSDAKDLF